MCQIKISIGIFLNKVKVIKQNRQSVMITEKVKDFDNDYTIRKQSRVFVWEFLLLIYFLNLNASKFL